MPFRPIRRARRLRALLVAALVTGGLVGCAAPPPVDPDSATVWGFVRLVPRKGASAAGAGYGDRRLARVRRVDYSHTRYAVVFAPTAARGTESPARLTIRESIAGLRLEPAFSVTSPGVGLELHNATSVDRIVSIPAAGRLERLAPGASVVIGALPSGEASIHLLGGPGSASAIRSQVWVTEGAFVEVEPNGRYVLTGIAPGPHALRAWHPRLPPSPTHAIELEAGSVERVDIEIGVDVHETQAEVAP